jgi:hypothetical protein
MRLPILSLFLIAAALLGEIQAASAQSPTTYPWCAKYYESWMFGTISCYYTSYETVYDDAVRHWRGLHPQPILPPGAA